jgi:hypothetical protein
MTWLQHILGLDDASSVPYLAWSGFGADLPIIGALIALGRRHNCHVHGCWRIGRHPVAGTGHVVCRHHHPDGAPSADDIRKARS